MAKKKKSSKPGAGKPRSAPRGMYLTAGISHRNGKYHKVQIDSFLDITRIGHNVARAVREYLRSVPMLPHVPAWSVTVWPMWHPTSKAVKKPKQAGLDEAAADLGMDDAG